MSKPCFATSSGDEAFSRKTALFQDNHIPHICMRGSARNWVVEGEVVQDFQASSSKGPVQQKRRDDNDMVCSHTCLENLQFRKR